MNLNMIIFKYLGLFKQKKKNPPITNKFDLKYGEKIVSLTAKV